MKIKNLIPRRVRCGFAATAGSSLRSGFALSAARLRSGFAATLVACVCCCVTATTLTSCKDKVDNVFGDSAANRIAQDQAKYYDILEGAAQGWVLDFYPDDRSEGGVAYTARFKDGDVTMTCEQDINNTVINKKFTKGTEVTSSYQIVSEVGVMLTFNTYNPLFHYWSQPFKGHMNGYRSDYEFTFLSASADLVVLKGKKYGNFLYMRPLQETGSDYVTKVADTHATLKGIPRKRAEIDGKEEHITMAYDMLNYIDNGTAKSVALINTPWGIRLYEPATIGGVSVSEMTYNKEDLSLRSPDGRVVLPKPSVIEDKFVATQNQWKFNYKYSTETPSDMCDELAAIIKQCSKGVTMKDAKSQNEQLYQLYVGANRESFANDKHRWVLGWVTRLKGTVIEYYVGYAINMELIDAANQIVSIDMIEGANLYSNYGFCQPFVDFVGNNSPYKVVFNNDTNPTEATLTSTKDPSKWFKLKR